MFVCNANGLVLELTKHDFISFIPSNPNLCKIFSAAAAGVWLEQASIKNNIRNAWTRQMHFSQSNFVTKTASVPAFKTGLNHPCLLIKITKFTIERVQLFV